MKLTAVRTLALSLPEVTEQPHIQFDSFRVRGKIFVTLPPGGAHVHVFVPECVREQAVALYPAFVDKLHWGRKVVGLRVTLAKAKPDVLDHLVRAAWEAKAPRSLVKEHKREDSRGIDHA